MRPLLATVGCVVLVGCGQRTPTFADDIAAIVYANCTPCHRPGESGPFPLLGYHDVFKKREQIARVTGRRLMPPWLPTHGDFVDERRLDTAAIDTIARWVDAGAQRGPATAEPLPPRFPTGWQLREPDLVVTAPEPIEVPADGPDTFRNLVIPLEVATLRFVEAVEIRPGSPAVHHAILNVDATRDCRRLDALDAEPGFAGMSLGMSHAPDGHFLGWTPGKRVRRQPPGMAWRLWPGQDLVLQVHLTPTGKPETVQPRIGFYFTDVATVVQPYSLVLYSEAIDIPPGVADHVVRDHITLPVPVEVHGIYPHAHYLCRRMGAEATLPDGTPQSLFRIDRWDFDWQDDYRYRQPLALPAGTRLAFDYHYDNTEANPANPHTPPRRVTFGQQSTDEMGTLTLTLVLGTDQDRRLLDAAAARRDVEKKPWDWAAWLRTAAVMRELGRIEAATAAVREALRLRPDYPAALCELGKCQQIAGQMEEAEASYRAAIRLEPDQSEARMHLGGMLAMAGQTALAIEQLEWAVRLQPNHPLLHNNLANAYFETDRLMDAARHYRRAVALDGGYFNPQFNLGRVLLAMGQRDEARRALERADALRPGDPAVAAALRELGR